MLTIRMIACVCLFQGALAFGSPSKRVRPAWSYAQKKLEAAGFEKSFVSSLRKSYEPQEFLTVVELNSLLFLRRADYHSPQVSEEAVEEVRRFLSQNRKALQQAEKRYGVSAPVIAGLLWMESRYGSNTGRFHVGSVFISLLQADRPQVVAHLRSQAVPRFANKLTPKVAADIERKASGKARWALHELKALQEIYKRDRKLALHLRGSFAGAFGMPQFIPSSYAHYARSAEKARKAADLTRAADAIQSVANYLKESGWRQARAGSHEQALLKYNNSHDYARAILHLAERAESSSERQPATKAH